MVIQLNPGAITSTTNAPVQGYSDMFRISPTINASAVKATPAPTAPKTSVVVAIPTPAPVAKAAVRSSDERSRPATTLLAAAKPITPGPAASPTTPSGPLASGKILKSVKKS